MDISYCDHEFYEEHRDVVNEIFDDQPSSLELRIRKTYRRHGMSLTRFGMITKNIDNHVESTMIAKSSELTPEDLFIFKFLEQLQKGATLLAADKLRRSQKQSAAPEVRAGCLQSHGETGSNGTHLVTVYRAS